MDEGPSNAPPKAGPRSAAWWTLGRVVTAMVLAFGVLILIGVIWNVVDPSTDHGDEADAIAACESQVEQQLKSPESASYSNEQIKRDDSRASDEAVTTYKVSGIVDSDNSLGASIRNVWTCSAVFDGDSWDASASLVTSN